MKKYARSFGLPALLLAAALVLASCAGSGPAQQGGSDEPGGDVKEPDHSNMPGMDHGDADTGSGEMARQMVSPGGEYSDAAFVDAMVPHHEGAVEMAQVALDDAEHEEIRTLSRDIVDGQQAEIEQFGQIRGRLGGSEMERMSEEEMNEMMGMTDAQDLAGQQPFDRAFIDAMVPHHESAIEMANVALEESEDPEILSTAGDIVSAQEAEIAQMQTWREEWYPES